MTFDDIWPFLRHFLMIGILLAAMIEPRRGKKSKNKEDKPFYEDANYEELDKTA